MSDPGSTPRTLIVDEQQAGMRLDVLLAEALGDSRSRAAARCTAGEVTVDGRPVAKQHRARLGEQVRIAVPDPVAVAAPPALPPIRYRDEHLLVVAKPAGMVVHPGAGTPDGTLVDALRGADIPLADVGDDRRPGIVHRLDRDTSGLLVVASSSTAAAGLIEALRTRVVGRRYLGLVRGEPARARGRIEGPIGRDPSDRLRFAVVSGGREAVTRYQRLDVGLAPEIAPHRATVSLLACRLLTGRTHQIRVHLTALGHPIVGDPTYGSAGEVARALGLTRPFLHAAALRFTHPVTGETVDLHEPLPEDLAAAAALAGVRVPADLPLEDGDEAPDATPSD
ncbi:MAG: RluA family pseudouridine synthase [Nitriliruptoraceae bacterium]|nr:RluA family pseudouridine synthase [Nitriliruptoraceae bacterium]